MSPGRGRRGCGIVGLIAVVALPVLLLAGGFTEGDAERDLYAGGWHWQAAGTSIVEASLAATLPLFLIGWFRDHWTRQGALLKQMAVAAYGAFIIHPPVLVGLAFAVQQLAVPAELKLLTVLVAGVAASFGLPALVRSWVLDHRGHALAHADAHRGEPVAGAAAPELPGKCAQQPGARRAERVAERDRAAVHVQAIVVEPEVAHGRKHL